jgi:hypothetical protein
MSISDCQECRELWQAYLHAMAAWIDLRDRQAAVVASGDLESFWELDAQVDAAAQSSAKAKQKAIEHQRTRHPNEKAQV